MREIEAIEFKPFYLNLNDESLWRQEERVHLTPKSFAVLCYLVHHAGQLVTRHDLFEALWPETYVSENALTVCIRELRHVLSDSARAPQYIETVRGRGYRFVATVTMSAQPLPDVVPADSPQLTQLTPSDSIVARDRELEALHRQFELMRQGQRQLVFLSGEAGIGKTTLADAFVSQATAATPLWIGRGQCIGHYGVGEPYLPLLDALGQLCRGAEGEKILSVLRQQAPSWLLQMPALSPPSEAEELERRSQGATQTRMLRELSEAIETLTLEQPLVLVLEDLHWSDYATLDWLSFVARRRLPARLFVLGTYRPADALVQDHPVNSIVHELERQGIGVKILLAYLPETGIQTYLARRFGPSLLPEALVPLLYQRTQGNPFFLVSIVDDLVQQGRLCEGVSVWELTGDLEEAMKETPVSVRRLIEQQFEQLTSNEQTLLEVASVAGSEFSAATLALEGEHTLDDMEAQCAALARRGQFIQASGTSHWPDGTVASRYQFIHALYRETLYERVTANRRQRLHLLIGLRLEAGYGDEAREITTELAEHFVRCLDVGRAIPYLRLAGEQAVQRSAYQDSMMHLTRALDLIRLLPDSDDRARLELMIQIGLGATLTAIKGWGALEAEQAYTRAKALCQQVGDAPQLPWVIRGLFRYHLLGANFETALALAQELFRLAQTTLDSEWLRDSHMGLGLCLYPLGQLSQSLHHLDRAMALFDSQPQSEPQPQPEVILYAGTKLGITTWAHASRVLWSLGFPDQALQRSNEAIALSQDVSHPLGQALPLIFAAELHQRLRNTQNVWARAEDCIALATTYGFPNFVARGQVLRGWALAAQGGEQEGLAQLRHGVEMWLDSGARFDLPWYLILLADAYKILGRPEEGLKALDDALEALRDTRQQEHEAEIHWLRGQLLLMVTPRNATEAESCFYQSLDIARRQQAKSFELRAVTSLARLWQSQDKRQDAYDLLVSVYGWFTEGFDTEDLKDAKVLLNDLQG